MSMIYTRRRRSQSFGSYGSFKDQLSMEKPVVAKPELIEGYAHLCFDEQGLWFRGILLTADGQSSYNLMGKRTRLEVTEENGVEEILNDDHSPDVVRDFPSPLRTPTIYGSVEIRSQDINAASGCQSRQNSLDSRTERELQFILEEIPMSGSINDQKQLKQDSSPVLLSQGGSQPVSRPGSPPSTQQIIRALDNLLIRSTSYSNSSVSERGQQQLDNFDSPGSFRSRSGSRSQQQLDSISVVYDITVADLEEGSQHSIRGVAGRKGNHLTLRNRQLCFVTERSFWGQRADMVIQKQIAAPEMVGQGCHVFAGPMRFYFYNPLTSGASSLTTNWCW